MNNDTLNRSFLVLLYALLGFGGSVYSALVFGAIGVCLAKLALGRLQLDWSALPVSIALAGLAYYVSGALMVVLQPGDANLSLLWERLPFLGFLPLIAQTSLSQREALRNGLEIGAIAGAFGVAVWVGIEFYLYQGPPATFRASGPAGNPGPFATTSAFLFAVTLFATGHGESRFRALAALGAVLSALAVGLSGMRTLLPVLVLVPLLYLIVFPEIRRAWLEPKILLVLAAACALFAVVTGPTIAERVSRLAADATVGFEPNASQSLGQRIAMWHCGWDAFTDAPLLGLGRAGAQDFMTECTLDITGKALAYSHFHNAVITALASGGLFELFATLLMLAVPVYWVWRRRHDPDARYGIALIGTVIIIFGLNGVANIMLDHDIHDALFIHATALGLAFLYIGDEPGGRQALSGERG